MGRLVSVILITWNSAEWLGACLGSVAAQNHEPLELIVVDNASSDASREIVREVSPDVSLIRNDANRGFSAAVNRGIGESRGEFVLLLNPDARMEPDYVSRLVRALEDAGERYGSATGTLFRGSGPEIEATPLIDSRGIRMTRSGRHFDIDAGKRAERPSGEPREVFGVSGAVALHRRALLDDVAIEGEVLDEDFFTYREDADLAWRARLFGWRALYVPQAVAYHVRLVTPAARATLSPEVNRHSVKNRFLLRLKNEGLWLALRNAIFEIPRDLIVLAALLTVERSSFPALTWLWSNRRRIAARRRAIQTRRVVGDRELARWFR
jgi:GT2 family glycosyltransferase